MKHYFSMMLFSAFWLMGSSLQAQQKNSSLTSVKESKSASNFHTGKKLFIDVHNLGPGKVSYEAVADAHAKDLATEGKYGVEFLKFWVDTDKGTVYCLVSAFDTESVVKTHA